MPRNPFEQIVPFPPPYRGPLRRAVLAGSPVLVRTSAAGDRDALRRLRNARAVGAQVPTPPALPVIELAAEGLPEGLVYADPGVVPLSLAPPVVQSVDAFLDRAIALVTAVSAMHAAQVVHRGLRPDVLLLGPAGEAYVAGFDEAAPLEVTSPAGRFDPAQASERLPWLAPEQTGRMNRGVDARADLYALGVVLFAEFAGVLPLQADDAAGWVHAHLARAPQPFPGPAPLAAMIDRLLAKNVEDRYQTAAGLLGDLREARALRAEGSWAGWLPSRHARADRFRLSETLHGRELPRAHLLRTLAEAAAGRPALALIRGVAGIGKSRLARELEPEVARRRGYFVTGKAPRLERDRPFAALVDALDDLVRQALVRPEAEVARLRAALYDALGANARVPASVLPAMATLLPDAAPVPELGAEAARLRLSRALAALVGVFAQAAHPLVLFLDDLQWADDATLELAAALLDPLGAPALLVVGTARDEALDAEHPLHRLVAAAGRRAVPVQWLVLEALGPPAVAAIVAETVGARPDEVTELAALVHAKTGANPFFIGQFLRSLHAEGLLVYDAEAARWRWDLSAIAQADLTDNVIALLTRALDRLEPEDRRTLLEAAVVGAVFDLGTLAALRGASVAAVAGRLAAARAAGLVVPEGEVGHPSLAEAGVRLRFAHDRVHEAALVALPPEERARLHCEIGALLRAAWAATRATGAPGETQRLFELCEHSLAGCGHLASADAREAVAHLCLEAAGRGRAAGAHEVALHVLRGAARLVDAETWGRDERLMLDLNLALAEAERLAGNTAQALALAEVVAAHARTPLDEAGVHELRTFLLTNQGRLAEAAAQVQQLVAVLGHPLVPPESPEALGAALMALVPEVLGHTPEALAAAPDVADLAVAAVVRVLGASLPTFAMGCPELHPTAVMLGIRLSLDHGVGPGSAAALSHLGIILCAIGQYAAGAAVGARSEALRHRGVAGGTTEGLVEFPSFIHHWTAPFGETLALLRVGARRSLELGDPMVFGYCLNQQHLLRVLAGAPLAPLEADFEPDNARLLQLGQQLAAWSVAIWAQTVDALRHPSADPTALVGERLDAETLAAARGTLPTTRAYATAARALLGVFFERPAVTLAVVAEDAEALASPAVAPSPLPPVVMLYEAVAAAMVLGADARPLDAPPLEEARAEALRARLAELGARLDALAAQCPANHGHRALLVAAERAALAGEALEAMTLFDRAADTAGRAGLPHERALAWQRAAAFHRRAGRFGVARAYLRDALAAYEDWGAEALVEHLWRAHATTLGERPVRGAAIGDALDLGTVLAAAEALGSEREVGPLVARLLRLVIENTGAERAVFALHAADGTLLVHRVARADAPLDERSAEESGVSVPLAQHPAVPHDLVNAVARAGTPLLLDDARLDARYRTSPDVRARNVRSVLCLPVLHQGHSLGVLYLENTLAPGVFTAERARLAGALISQAAISLQNALLLSEARASAARLAAQNEQLTEVDRLRDTILTRTSHELRTPLHGIIGLARSLLDGTGGPLAPLVRQNLEMVASSGQRLAHLVNDILDFSTLREDRLKLEPRPMDAAALVDRVLALLAPLAAQKGLTLARAADGPPAPAALADPDRVEQVLLNLVGNAIKFTDVGAVTVTVGWARADAVRLAEGPGAAPFDPERFAAGAVRISVTDTGPGIAAADHARIFEPFDQGTQAGLTHHGGAGLGLAVARQLVALHGGGLGLESSLGAGARFWFDLPAHAPRPATGGLPTAALLAARGGAEARTRRPKTPPPLRQPTPDPGPVTAPLPSLVGPAIMAGTALGNAVEGPLILAVDDEPINLQVLLQTLTPQGYRVETALSGQAALDRLAEEPLPDLVLLDVMMPRMDGLEVCRRIRLRHPAAALPVIMVTARNQPADLVDGLAAGANDYVSKPFSATELRARLRTHLSLAHLHRAVGRFVPQAFVELLGRADVAGVNLGDHTAQRMTVLFADMRAFGRLARSLDPQGSFEFVNEYLGVLEPVVIAHGGFVDKYIGDKVMALFAGDPVRAVAAGVAMLEALEVFNRQRHDRGLVPIQVGIGLNTGDLMLGTVGSPSRMDTTVISDAVNIAHRVEALTRRFNASLLATGATCGDLTALPHRRLLDHLRIDEAETVEVFEIYASDAVGVRAGKDATRETFERGVRAFHARRFEDALRCFKVCQALHPSDPAVRHYLERCARVRQYFAGEGL